MLIIASPNSSSIPLLYTEQKILGHNGIVPSVHLIKRKKKYSLKSHVLHTNKPFIVHFRILHEHATNNTSNKIPPSQDADGTALHELVRTIKSSFEYNQETLAVYLDIEGSLKSAPTQ